MTAPLLIGGIGVLLGIGGLFAAVLLAGPAQRPDRRAVQRRSHGRGAWMSANEVGSNGSNGLDGADGSGGSGGSDGSGKAGDGRRLLVVVSSAGSAIVALALTRWPVAAALAAVAGGGLPRLLRSLSSTSHIDRIEAVAAWTELLRDTLAAAAGLGQAVMATAELAPRPIRANVVRLADRLANGVPIEDGLRAFADEMDDASTDIVVCALLVAAKARSQKLADLLGALAASCRDEAALRLRIEASRASARSSVRSVALISVAFAALLFVFAHSYLAPFGTTAGQIVLLAVGACYAAGLVIMVMLVRARPAYRLLGGGTES